MEENMTAILQKLKASGIVKDPQLLDRLDEPAPLWVVLELLHGMLLRMEPPEQPYD